MTLLSDDLDDFMAVDLDDFMAVDLTVMPPPEVKPRQAAQGLAGAIVASMDKWARKPADLYPTPTDCTYSMLPYIAPFLPPKAVVWEPACADGKMVQPLREFGYEVIGTDLRPGVLGGEGGIDFLAADSDYHLGDYDAIITNPPFGCADKFITTALQHAPVVVMLLKAQYWNVKKRRKLYYEHRPALELNLTWRPAFLAEERGNSPLMDCMWVVWRRGHNGGCEVELLERLMTCPQNFGDMDMGGL